MDFEDIVDMDWLNSHTIESSTISPLVKEEANLERKATSLFDYYCMPSTDQIKQLIDITKRQLALREQLTSISEPEEVSISIEPTNISTSKHAFEQELSLEAYAANDGIEINKLSSKERRQLRNKISARNFRVRRKEYITSLEGQVDEHEKENKLLSEKLNQMEEENKQLKLQVESLKCQNLQLQDTTSILVS